jgi:hypothetical protein
MAQTGYTPIQLYYSSTTTNVPLAANLAYGELAINITDGKLFYKDNANAIQVIGWKVVPATAGGTGQTSYAVGDLIYADTTTTLAKLPDVATGNALISGGVSTAPSWGKIGLTTHVSGVLPVANGGTNASSASITAFNNITGYTASGATGTTSTNLVFSTSPSITTPTFVGDVTLSTGNLVVSNGKGIDFSATPGTGTSELLADYEEGTWTPTFAFAGGSTGITGTFEGSYTKVGRLVTLIAQVTLTSKGSSTGAIAITNLPFNGGNYLPNTSIEGSGSVGLYTATSSVYGMTVVLNNGDTLLIYGAISSGAASLTQLDNTNITNTTALRLSIQYFA